MSPIFWDYHKNKGEIIDENEKGIRIEEQLTLNKEQKPGMVAHVCNSQLDGRKKQITVWGPGKKKRPYVKNKLKWIGMRTW
jgi:hypothetical protein